MTVQRIVIEISFCWLSNETVLSTVLRLSVNQLFVILRRVILPSVVLLSVVLLSVNLLGGSLSVVLLNFILLYVILLKRHSTKCGSVLLIVILRRVVLISFL